MRAAIAIALLGLVAAVAYPLATRQTRIERERAAIAWLRAVAEAQTHFRASQGGYAGTLDSLSTPCPPTTASTGTSGTSDTPGTLGTLNHTVTLRPAATASEGPLDCHGRPTFSDFYASARPNLVGRDGLYGLALTATGRIFVFFEGVPPTEQDMAAGGLATPLDEGH